jgi:hypothetical protein
MSTEYCQTSSTIPLFSSTLSVAISQLRVENESRSRSFLGDPPLRLYSVLALAIADVFLCVGSFHEHIEDALDRIEFGE